jgi:hypothetical protein
MTLVSAPEGYHELWNKVSSGKCTFFNVRRNGYGKHCQQL